MFAVEHCGVAPDLILVAKTLGGGLPLAGVIGRAGLMDATAPGGIGGTFGGNPVTCAAALAVIDVLTDENLAERAERLGQAIRARMIAWQERYPAIGDVRGLGAMNAMELVAAHNHRAPAPALATAIVRACHDRGLLILKAGLHDNLVRLLPPLNLSDADLREGLGIIEDALPQALLTGSAESPHRQPAGPEEVATAAHASRSSSA